jgi:hypothetical protein
MLRLGAAATAAALLVGAAQAGMAEGTYECWYFSQAQPGLNVTVTGPTTYTAVADGSTGEYALSGTNLTWVSGLMKGAMPDGFTTLYEVRQGIPTIAFMSGRGAEAAFCQNTGG